MQLKKTVLAVMAAAALFAGACTNTELQDKVDNLDARLSKVEAAIEKINGDISTLRQIVNKLSEGYVVTSCDEIDGGYRITFSDGSYVDILNGKDGRDGREGADGRDGSTPEIGLKQDPDNGNWYWTLGGEWLTDPSGARIKANGEDAITPEVKTEGGYWWLSTDGGESWEKLAPYHDPSANVISEIRQDERTITLTLSDGTEIVLPRKQKLEISFDGDTITAFTPGETKSLGFTVTGGTEKNTVKAVGQGGWIASVKMTDPYKGTLYVTAPDPVVDCDVVIIASDGEGYTVIGSLSLEEGTIQFTADSYTVSGKGGTLQVHVSTNVKYVPVPDSDWVSFSETKSVREDVLVFDVKENMGPERVCRINLLVDGIVRAQATIAQDAVALPGRFGISSPSGKVFSHNCATGQTGVYEAGGKSFSRLLVPASLLSYEIGPIPGDATAGTVFNGSLSVFEKGTVTMDAARTFTVLDISGSVIRLTDNENWYYVLRF